MKVNADALLARLLRRAHAPLGVIDTRPERRAVERWRDWSERRQVLSTRLLARRGDDNEAAVGATAAAVHRFIDAEARAAVAAAPPPAAPAQGPTPSNAARADGPAASDSPSFRLRRMPLGAIEADAPSRSAAAAPAMTAITAMHAAHERTSSRDAPSVPMAPMVPRVRAVDRPVEGRATHDDRRAAVTPIVAAVRGPTHSPSAEWVHGLPTTSQHPARTPSAQRTPLVERRAPAEQRTLVIREQRRTDAVASLAPGDAVAPLAPATAVAALATVRPTRPSTQASSTAGEPSSPPTAAVANPTAPPTPAPAATARRDLPTHQLVDRVARVVLRRLADDLERRGGKPWR